MKVTKQTIIKKLNEGIENCGWEILNGLGTSHWKGGGSLEEFIKPLVKYLESKNITVTK